MQNSPFIDQSRDCQRGFLNSAYPNLLRTVVSGASPKNARRALTEALSEKLFLSMVIKVEIKIINEIKLRNYRISPSKPYIVSSLGCIPKDSDVRLTHDCSRPHDRAVNDYANATYQQKFVSIDTAICLTDRNLFMCKVDLSNGNRHVPIHTKNYNLTGLKSQSTIKKGK